MKIILIPDSFKGTMTSKEVCSVEADTLKCYMPESEITKIPIADGGEGTVDCFLYAMKGEKVEVVVKDAFGRDIKSFYGKLDNLGVIEMAAAAGMVSNSQRDPMTANTFGVGQLIKHAVNNGCDTILLGLGGSCTNDAGAGMAAALGTRFCDKDGNEFVPNGKTLCDVANIENSGAEELMKNVSIKCMCDIDNPLYGVNGAAYVFGPQKGANEEQIKCLDDNLRYFSEVINNELGIDISNTPGGGAAGGMGAGAKAFLGAELQTGIEIMLDVVNFDDKLKDCDLVITGEGKLDRQSLGGKVVKGVADRANAHKVPVVAVVGTVEKAKDFSEDDLCNEMGIAKVYAASNGQCSMDKLRSSCHADLREAVCRLTRDLQSQGKY